VSLDFFWREYERTLKRVRDEQPQSLAELKPILDELHQPSSGAAFFGNFADDHLDDALRDAGWLIAYIEGDYLWEARSKTGAWVHYVEGDVYEGPYRLPETSS
jgi:hypothetical protein